MNHSIHDYRNHKILTWGSRSYIIATRRCCYHFCNNFWSVAGRTNIVTITVRDTVDSDFLPSTSRLVFSFDLRSFRQNSNIMASIERFVRKSRARPSFYRCSIHRVVHQLYISRLLFDQRAIIAIILRMIREEMCSLIYLRAGKTPLYPLQYLLIRSPSYTV